MADITDATFEDQVIQRSTQVPVVVDLWADWCQPCKTLGPILEKVIGETGGQVELAKVDIESNPAVAQAFNVQSIPAVFAFRDGQVVDHFLGALPESDVRDFVNKLVPAPALSEAEQLAELGDEASLRRAVELEPQNANVVIALAEFLAANDQGEEADRLLDTIPETADVRRTRALARRGPQSSTDIELRLVSLLDNVRSDDEARQEFVDLLELLHDDDPAKSEWRRKLSSQLF